jgi:hypothetical protein
MRQQATSVNRRTAKERKDFTTGYPVVFMM